MNDLPEFTPVEFEPMKINFGFPHFAVCISPNFRRIKVIPAHIHPSETVHRVGIVPGTDIFDSYKDEMVSVTLNMDGLSEPDIKEQCIYMFGALVVMSDKPNIYQSCCREVEEGKLIAAHNGFIGFFKSSEAAITAIEKERAKYIAALQSDMNAVISISNVRNLFANSTMDIPHIFEEVKKWTKERYRPTCWIWQDYFAEKCGYENFVEQIEKDIRDGNITKDMSDDEIITHIEDTLLSNHADGMMIVSHIHSMLGSDFD